MTEPESELPEAVQELAKQLGVKIKMLPGGSVMDSFAAIVQENDDLKQKNMVAKQACMALLHQMGGSATITATEADQIVKQFTFEYRTDSATDSVHLYLKVKP